MVRESRARSFAAYDLEGNAHTVEEWQTWVDECGQSTLTKTTFRLPDGRPVNRPEPGLYVVADSGEELVTTEGG
jgi:hypothetical protein